MKAILWWFDKERIDYLITVNEVLMMLIVNV